jgi:hypothetical protein
MTMLRSPDEIIVSDVQPLPQIQKTGSHFIAMSLGIDSPFFSRLLDFLTMFIQPGKKKNLFPGRTMKAGQYVCQNRRIGMTNMRFVVHIVDRCGDIKCGFHDFNRTGS